MLNFLKHVVFGPAYNNIGADVYDETFTAPPEYKKILLDSQKELAERRAQLAVEAAKINQDNTKNPYRKPTAIPKKSLTKALVPTGNITNFLETCYQLEGDQANRIQEELTLLSNKAKKGEEIHPVAASLLEATAAGGCLYTCKDTRKRFREFVSHAVCPDAANQIKGVHHVLNAQTIINPDISLKEVLQKMQEHNRKIPKYTRTGSNRRI
jgi:hypothetical protein